MTVTSTGDILAGASDNTGIWRSSDNGINWTRTGAMQLAISSIIETVEGRLVAGLGYAGPGNIRYSNDGGITWIASKITDGSGYALANTKTGRLLAGVGSTGIWYSDSNIEIKNIPNFYIKVKKVAI